MELTFVFEDLHIIEHLGHRLPYKRRVTIKLTPEQVEQLKPKEVGSSNGKTTFESIVDLFIEQPTTFQKQTS